MDGQNTLEQIHTPLTPAWQDWVAPVRVRFWRAAGEALLGWAAIGILSGHAWWQFANTPRTALRDIFVVLAWCWLFIWPAWRLRPAAGVRWWSRALRGLGRLVALACVFAALLWILSAVFSGTGRNPLTGVPPGIVFFSFVLVFFRAITLIAVAVGHWIRSRIYRQLLVSHLLVIMMTFVGLVAIGVLLAIGVTVSTWPDAATQAEIAADALPRTVHTTTLDRYQAQGVLDGLRSGRVRPNVHGSSPIVLLAPWWVYNLRTQVVDRAGTVIAAERSDNMKGGCAGPATIPLPPAIRDRLVQGALAGTVPTAPVPAALACSGSDTSSTGQLFAAAPVRATGEHGRILAVVIVQGRQTAFTALQGGRIFQVAVVGFGVATFLVITITALPTLIISSLAALIFARGLTRRLVAVSQAAAAIADGDLSRRAPVTAHNEIGRLAQDFNRMAASQEHAIADLQQARTQAEQARSQAEQALRARQELVASVSHELRTPIAVVQAHLDTLQMQGGAVAAEREIRIPVQTLDGLRHELDRLAGLVDDLFALARVETGALQLHVAPTDVAALVRELAALLRPLAQRESAITIAVDLPPNLPRALVDGDRLRQILANLVRNAIRHTPEGGIIALSARAEGPWVALAVADTGEGIAPEHLPRIFDRFYRVDQARTRSGGGAGLGLAIVREFVEGMGGHVTVESTVGEGTCFRVYLAVAEAQPAGAATAYAAPRQPSEKEAGV